MNLVLNLENIVIFLEHMKSLLNGFSARTILATPRCVGCGAAYGLGGVCRCGGGREVMWRRWNAVSELRLQNELHVQPL